MIATISEHANDLIFTHLDVLRPFMEDPTVTEINVNWDGGICIERQGESRLLPGLTIDRASYQFGVQEIANSLKGTSLTPENPRLNAGLPGGHRVAILAPPLSDGGVTMSIRKHRKQAFTLLQLIEDGTIPQEVVDHLHEPITRTFQPANVAFSGPTGSGKTSCLAAFLQLLNPDFRMGFIEEDVPEIKKDSFPNHFPFVTNPSYTIRDLVKEALRHRPDRLVVGEVRDGRAILDLLDALNTGHSGSFTTGHANSARHFLNRLRTLVLQSDSPAGHNYQALGYQIADALQYVVHMGRLRQGNGYGKRRVLELIHVKRYSAKRDQFVVETLYQFK